MTFSTQVAHVIVVSDNRENSKRLAKGNIILVLSDRPDHSLPSSSLKTP